MRFRWVRGGGGGRSRADELFVGHGEHERRGATLPR
jgi:hypothetical protein